MELPAQRLAPPAKEPGHAARSAPQVAGDLQHVPIPEMAEEDGLALTVRKPRDGPRHPQAVLLLHGHFARRGLAGSRQFLDPDRRMLQSSFQGLLASASAPLATEVPDPVRDDARQDRAQPTRHLRWALALELVDLLVCPQQSVLHDVRGADLPLQASMKPPGKGGRRQELEIRLGILEGDAG